MVSKLTQHLVQLETDKNIKDGFTHKLALSLIHDMEAACGETEPDPSELVHLRRMSIPGSQKNWGFDTL